MKCDRCGIESPFDAAFRPVVRVFQKPWRYCPICADGREHSLLNRSSLVGFLFIVVCGAFALGVASPQDRSVLLFAPLLLVFFWLGIVPHELAHAFAARVLGLRVFRVSIGFWGPIVWRWMIFGTEICVRPLWSGGLATVGAPSLRFIRWRWLLMVAAGPLANVLLAAAALCLRPTASWGELLVVPFVTANIVLIVLSLFPWHHATPLGHFRSDGLVLMSSPFAARAAWVKLHVFYFAQEAAEQIQRKNYQAAIAWAERGLREYPADNSLRGTLGVAQLGLDDFSSARKTFLDCLEACGEDLGQRALFLNNIAWTDLFTDHPTLLEEADRYSAEAIRIAPWFSWIRGTRGMVLVELEHLDEGIDLLNKALGGNREPQNRAQNACCLAIAFAKKRDLDESRKYLEKARELDPDCSLIPRVEKEVAAREALV
jgi:tetratricopeptide (TPR) repeat protein